MNLYFELMQIPVFTIEDVCKYYDKIESAHSAVKRLIKQGTVVKIRNKMYTCISGESREPIANRFQIASCITSTSYVSYHTAMEYYGVANQVYYDVYVSTETKFQAFDFYGYTYQCILAKCKQGIESVKYSGGVKVTDKERTLVDCLKDMDKISGLEETMANVQGLHNLQQKKILQYLEEYDNQFLYQKMGFLLGNIRTQLGLSDAFFVESLFQQNSDYCTVAACGRKKQECFLQRTFILPKNILMSRSRKDRKAGVSISVMDLHPIWFIITAGSQLSFLIGYASFQAVVKNPIL